MPRSIAIGIAIALLMTSTLACNVSGATDICGDAGAADCGGSEGDTGAGAQDSGELPKDAGDAWTTHDDAGTQMDAGPDASNACEPIPCPSPGWDPVRCACRECEISQKAAPVCGSDGQTYMNRELAACAGVGIARAGNCDCPATLPTAGTACPSSSDFMQCGYAGPLICECSPTRAWDCSGTWCGYCYDKASDACVVGTGDAACGSGAVQECKDCAAQGMVCDRRGAFCAQPTESWPDVIDGIWLIGTYPGDPNRFSWIRFASDVHGVSGTVDILSGADLTNNIPWWGCSGRGAWFMSRAPDTITIDLPAACSQARFTFWFENLYPADIIHRYPPGMTLEAALKEPPQPTPLAAYKFPASQCDAAMTACADPLK
jgi:hypothetical protein